MADRFRDLVSTESNKFIELCEKWDSINNDESEIPDEVRGEIRSTVGCAQLLMAERFKQFSGLIDNMEFNLGEQPTTEEDLQGFWDLVFIQVEDVNKKFNNLEQLKSNDWQEVTIINAPAPKPRPMRKAVTKKPQDASRALEARKRLAEAKALAAKTRLINEEEVELEKENVKTFDAPSFFSVSSPVKKPVIRSSTLELSSDFSKKLPLTPKKTFTPKKTSPCPKSLLCLNRLSPAVRKALGPIEMPQTQQ